MAKPKRRYVCQACGGVSPRWQGQCPDCNEWSTLQEDAPETVFSSKHDLSSGGRAVAFVALDQPVKLPERRKTGLAELDRALERTALDWGRKIVAKSPTAQRMLKYSFNLIDDGLVGQQLFAGEATRLAYGTDEAVEGRDSFLQKREPNWSAFPWHF